MEVVGTFSEKIQQPMKRYAAQNSVDMDVFTQEVSTYLLHVAVK